MKDIDVETSVFSRANSDIKRRINVLLGCAEALSKNINYAQNEFNSINYTRAKEYVDRVVNSLNSCSIRVEKLNKYLKDLDNDVHKYLNIRIGD